MEWKQHKKNLLRAIEAGDATAQVKLTKELLHCLLMN